MLPLEMYRTLKISAVDILELFGFYLFHKDLKALRLGKANKSCEDRPGFKF